MTPAPPADSSGAAGELSLRVSVATLVRVVFDHPQAGQLMLALERKATLFEPAGQQAVRVSAQPFGGAIRLRDPAALQSLLSDFQFDSQRSRAEQDFRLLIRPADWPRLRAFVVRRLAAPDDAVLDADPARELAEEFADALALHLRPEQYTLRPLGVRVQDAPVPTTNPRAPGRPTARIHRLFEARLQDAALAQAVLANSARYTDDDLRDQALARLRQGGPGRANAALVLPLPALTAAYQSLAPAARAAPFNFDGHSLEPNVMVVLSGD